MTNDIKSIRPTSITVVCVIGFIGAALSFPLVFLETTKSIASWYPMYLGTSALLGFISMLGLWKMKKWGALLYIALVIANQIVLLMNDLWDYTSIILPGIVCIIALLNIKKMS